jgi:formate-dependent nitrite reductase membrane component NrfD
MHEISWELPVIGYLFLAGVGAGAILVSAALTLGAGNFGASRETIARYGAFIAPFPVIIGTVLIIWELGQPFRALNLFHQINISPMSFGSWFIGLFSGLAVVYAMTFLPLPEPFKTPAERIKRICAWISLPLGIALAIYTAIMIGAMPARPFWNSPVISILFTLSALSGGVAAVMLALTLLNKDDLNPEVTEDHHRGLHTLGSTDIGLLVGELLVIFFFLLFAQMSISNVKEAANVILPGGELAVPFWGLMVGVGILIPVILETAVKLPQLSNGQAVALKRIIEISAPIAVLIGGFTLRYVFVIAGQITGPIGI